MKRQEGILNKYCQVKQANVKGYILYDSNCVTFWERQSYGDSKRVSYYRVGGGRTMWSTKDFKAMKLLHMILHWWTHVIMHLSKPTGYTIPRMNLS